MKKLPDDMTLGEARQLLRDGWGKGVRCPCCTQFVKLYKRSLPVASAVVMIAMSKAKKDADGYVFLPTVLDTLKGTAHQGGYGTLAQFWGLIESKPVIRDDGSNRVGYWRFTGLGNLFVAGMVTVPKYVRIFNGKSYGSTGDEITIQQALGNKFNYDELMKAK